MKKVIIELDECDAKELAGYLSGTDMRMSVGDRYFLSLKIYNALKRSNDERS